MSATVLEPRVTKKPRRQRAENFEPRLSFDPGPSVRQRTDGQLFSRGPGKVTLEDREDLSAEPDRNGNRPIVRGARRKHNSLDDLLSRGTITKRMVDAANRFLDDCSIASGGGGSADWSGIPSSPSPRAGLPESQVSAIGRVHAVIRLLGLNDGTVFWWVLFGDGGLREYEDRHKMAHGSASGMIKSALTALDEFYNSSERKSRGVK